MATITSQNFDGVTAPALPAGWTFNGAWATNVTVPRSPLNELLCSTINAVGLGTFDTIAGHADCVVQAALMTFAVSSQTNQQAYVCARFDSQTFGSANGYMAGIFFGSGETQGLHFGEMAAGTFTVAVSVPFTPVNNVYYLTTFTLTGSTITVRVQRDSDNNYLTSGGAWQAGATDAISTTDSTVSAAGYVGLCQYLAPSLVSFVCFDDFLATDSSGPPSDEVVITSPVPYLTRQVNGSNVADIPITGTYVGTPTALEASFNGGAYQTIVGSPAGGTFSGTLSGQSAGVGTLTVRFTNDTGILDTVSLVKLGDVFILGCDSIGVGHGTNPQSYSGTPTCSKYNGSGWADGNDPINGGTSYSQWPLLATLIMAFTGRPVAFVSCGVDNTDVLGVGDADNWVKNNAAYAAMVSRCTAAGTGGFKAFLAHLEPNAIVQASTPSFADYNAAIDTLAANVAADVTGAPPILVVVCGEVSTGTPPDRRLAEDNVRTAIIQAWDDNGSVGVGPVLTNATAYADGVHPATDAELLMLARRWWPALYESVFGGAAGYGRGPRVTSARIDSGLTTITVTVDRDLASGTTYGGFRVLVSGTPATVVSATRTGTRTIDVVVSAPVSSAAATTLSFSSGDDGVGVTIPTSSAVTLPDSNTVTLPMEPTIGFQVTEASSTLPAGDVTTQLTFYLNSLGAGGRDINTVLRDSLTTSGGTQNDLTTKLSSFIDR